MIKKSPIALAAFLIVVGTSAMSILPSTSYAQTAEKKEASKVEVIRAEWAKPYDEIAKLIGAKDFKEATAKLSVLSASEKITAYEQFVISRTKAVIANGTSDTNLLASAFDEMIKSEFTAPDEKLRFTEAIAGEMFNAKRYPESQAWVQRYLAIKKDSAVMQDLLARNYYLMNDFASTLREVNAQIQADESANRIPAQDRIRLLHGSYSKLKDAEGITKALELLVKYYPTKEYWADLLYRIPSKPTFSERLRLDWYRMMLATDSIEDAAQYTEMAELALLVGLPLEAKNVMEAGFKVNLLGVGKNAAKHKPLLDKATKQAADDAKKLDVEEAAAKASKNGLGMTNMGYNFILYGQFERGIALIEQGIAKGGLKQPEEAKLHLGLAYLRSGNKEKAKEVFKTVQGVDGAADMARYWTMMK